MAISSMNNQIDDLQKRRPAAVLRTTYGGCTTLTTTLHKVWISCSTSSLANVYDVHVQILNSLPMDHSSRCCRPLDLFWRLFAISHPTHRARIEFEIITTRLALFLRPSGSYQYVHLKPRFSHYAGFTYGARCISLSLPDIQKGGRLNGFLWGTLVTVNVCVPCFRVSSRSQDVGPSP